MNRRPDNLPPRPQARFTQFPTELLPAGAACDGCDGLCPSARAAARAVARITVAPVPPARDIDEIPDWVLGGG